MNERRSTDEQLLYEDVVVGEEFTTPSRTITEADIVNFAGLSADYNALHVDDEYARATSFGSRVAHGLLVLSVTSGLATRIPFSLALQNGIKGLLEVTCRWPNPTLIGDTVHVKIKIADKSLTSSGRTGVLTMIRTTVNQRDEIVMESDWKLLIATRDAAA